MSYLDLARRALTPPVASDETTDIDGPLAGLLDEAPRHRAESAKSAERPVSLAPAGGEGAERIGAAASSVSRWPPNGCVAPLDEAIARDVAHKSPRAEIVTRLGRLTARAAAPDATNLDRRLAAYWAAILTAKDAGGTA